MLAIIYPIEYDNATIMTQETIEDGDTYFGGEIGIRMVGNTEREQSTRNGGLYMESIGRGNNLGKI